MRIAWILLLLLLGCATPESRERRVEVLRAEADAAAVAIDAAAARCHGLSDPAEQARALAEIDEARDALGVARSGAAASAKLGDDASLDEIEAVLASLRRWAEEFPTRR